MFVQNPVIQKVYFQVSIYQNITVSRPGSNQQNPS